CALGGRARHRRRRARRGAGDAVGGADRERQQALVRDPLTRLPAHRLQIPSAGHTVNHMVQYQTHLDATFAALSDVTRRGVLEQLGSADASISELAQRFEMTLTGMKKHVSVLEQAGLV